MTTCSLKIEIYFMLQVVKDVLPSQVPIPSLSASVKYLPLGQL